MPREAEPRQPLCADIDGFSLYATVRGEPRGRKRPEQLCRYITRPALADERVQFNAAGQVELKPKTPWRNGITDLVMSPPEIMHRLTRWRSDRGCAVGRSRQSARARKSDARLDWRIQPPCDRQQAVCG